MQSIFIKNGTVIDGTVNCQPVVKNILIKEQKIACLSDDIFPANIVIDASGMIVSPGFIDTHTHSEFTLLADGRAHGRIAQGVTTEINGNCGLSAAPLYGAVAERREADIKQYDIKERWQTFDEYFNLLMSKGIAINFATLCGHGNIRGSVIGYADRIATTSEIRQMQMLFDNALQSGARGISTGLIYPPGIYSNLSELVEITSVANDYNGLYVTHMRSESDFLIESIEEAIQIGREAKVAVHISHLKTGGKSNWHKIDAVIDLLQKNRQTGLNITCDRYPYIASSTDLDVVLPKWVFEGGYDDEVRRLKDPILRAKIIEHLKKEDISLWDEILISYTVNRHNHWMQGKTLSNISHKLNKQPYEVVIDILIDEGARTGAIFFSMCEENLIRFLGLPYLTIGSDSAVRCYDGVTAQGMPHPRGFGSFARVIGRYVRQKNVLPLKDAIYKMTGLPAKIFKLLNRGVIKEGNWADIVIFDLNNFIDRADFANPFQMPDGIKTVIVNGIIALDERGFTNSRSGMIIR